MFENGWYGWSRVTRVHVYHTWLLVFLPLQTEKKTSISEITQAQNLGCLGCATQNWHATWTHLKVICHFRSYVLEKVLRQIQTQSALPPCLISDISQRKTRDLYKFKNPPSVVCKCTLYAVCFLFHATSF